MKKQLTTILMILLVLAAKTVGATPVVPPSTPVWGSTPYVVFSSSEIGIFWATSTSSVGLAGYNIYRCQGASCSLPSLPTMVSNDPTATFFADATVSAGTVYKYAIAAYDTAGNISARSTIITPTSQGTVSIIVPIITLTSPTTGVGTVGQSFTFNMNQSNLGVGVPVFGNSSYSWNWDFGDGGNINANGAASIVHQYTSPGTYVLTLRIFNNTSTDQAIVQQNITILPATATGAVLRMRFNGDVNDYSGNNLQITAGGSGMPAFAAGEGGHGMYLTGTSGGSFADVKDNAAIDGLSAMSISLYVMKNTASASGNIFSKQGQYSMALGAQGITATLTNASNSTVTLSAPTVANNDTNFHHYALTYNGTTATLYFDGTAVVTQSFSGTIASSSADLLIGEASSGVSFNGSFDWVRLYNQALSTTQVVSLYNGTLFGDISGDAIVTMYDAYLAGQFLLPPGITLSSTQLKQGEVSLDATISAADELLIEEKSVGLILKFPADVSQE